MNEDWLLYICVLVVLILYLIVLWKTDYYGSAVAERYVLIKDWNLPKSIKILENKGLFKTYYTIVVSIPFTKYETLLKINHHSKWKTEEECLEALDGKYKFVRPIGNWYSLI